MEELTLINLLGLETDAVLTDRHGLPLLMCSRPQIDYDAFGTSVGLHDFLGTCI